MHLLIPCLILPPVNTPYTSSGGHLLEQLQVCHQPRELPSSLVVSTVLIMLLPNLLSPASPLSHLKGPWICPIIFLNKSPTMYRPQAPPYLCCLVSTGSHRPRAERATGVSEEGSPSQHFSSPTLPRPSDALRLKMPPVSMRWYLDFFSWLVIQLT